MKPFTVCSKCVTMQDAARGAFDIIFQEASKRVLRFEWLPMRTSVGLCLPTLPDEFIKLDFKIKMLVMILIYLWARRSMTYQFFLNSKIRLIILFMVLGIDEIHLAEFWVTFVGQHLLTV